jgi:hypothetical protein
MQVNSHLDTPSVLLPVPLDRKEAGWTPEPLRTPYLRERGSHSYREPNPGLSVRSIIIILASTLQDASPGGAVFPLGGASICMKDILF